MVISHCVLWENQTATPAERGYDKACSILAHELLLQKL